MVPMPLPLRAPAATVRVQLSRMVSRGVLTRIRQGLYANPFSLPSVDEVAMVLRSPAYISIESALARHSVWGARQIVSGRVSEYYNWAKGRAVTPEPMGRV